MWSTATLEASDATGLGVLGFRPACDCELKAGEEGGQVCLIGIEEFNKDIEMFQVALASYHL